MRRFLTGFFPSILITASALAACSDTTENPLLAGDPNAGGGFEEAEDEDAGGPEATPSAKDAGKDAGKKDAGPTKDAADDAKDAATDTTPLACVPANPPAACPNGTLGTFTSQPIPTTLGNSTQLRTDPAGSLHAAWPNSGVFYMTNRSGSFVVEHVWQPSGLPNEKALASRLLLDDCGRPLVLYRTQHQPAGSNTYVFRVFLATKVTGGWVHEEVSVPKSDSDSTPATDVETANFTLDGNGVPVIAVTRYSDYTVTLLRRKAGGGFDLERTTVAASSSNLPLIAWSSTLGIVLAYANVGPPGVAWKSGAVWNTYPVTGAMSVDSFSSNYEAAMALETAPDGRVHVAWRSYTASGRVLRYASIAGADSWSATAAVPLPYINMPTAITILLPAGSAPRVTFDQFDGGLGKTYVSRSSAGVFGTASAVATASNSASAIDANGREYVMTVGYQNSTQVGKLWVQNCAP